MRASHDLVDCMRCTHERLKRLEQFFVVAIQRDDTDAKRSNATIVDATTEWDVQNAVELIWDKSEISDLESIKHALKTLSQAPAVMEDAGVNVSVPTSPREEGDVERFIDFKERVYTVCDRHKLNPNDWVNAWKYLASRMLIPNSHGFQAGIRWIDRGMKRKPME